MKTKVLILPSIALIIVSAFCHFLYLHWPYLDKMNTAFEILCCLCFFTGLLAFIPARSLFAIWIAFYVVILKFIGDSILKFIVR